MDCHAELFGMAKSISRGLECRRFGIRPAFEFQRGKIALRKGDDA